MSMLLNYHCCLTNEYRQNLSYALRTQSGKRREVKTGIGVERSGLVSFGQVRLLK